MPSINLTKGYSAIVSEADFDRLSAHKWHVNMRRPTHPYAQRFDSIKKRRISMHHEVAGTPPETCVVDHINGNTLDNRRDNLRFATHSQNARNSRHNRSRGHDRNIDLLPSGNYRIIARLSGAKYTFGSYATVAEARAARDAFVLAHELFCTTPLTDNPELLARMQAAGLKVGLL